MNGVAVVGHSTASEPDLAIGLIEVRNAMVRTPGRQIADHER
jgi:hypothetical protein